MEGLHLHRRRFDYPCPVARSGTRTSLSTTERRSTKRGTMFDDRPKQLETIDELVTEKREELDRIYDQFMVNGVHRCPICKSLEKGNINEENKAIA